MILDFIARILPESEASPTRPSTDKMKQAHQKKKKNGDKHKEI